MKACALSQARARMHVRHSAASRRSEPEAPSGTARAPLAGCLFAAWLPGCLAAWLPGCLAAWLPGCLAVWLSGCMAFRMPAYQPLSTPTQAHFASLSPNTCTPTWFQPDCLPSLLKTSTPGAQPGCQPGFQPAGLPASWPASSQAHSPARLACESLASFPPAGGGSVTSGPRASSRAGRVVTAAANAARRKRGHGMSPRPSLCPNGEEAVGYIIASLPRTSSCEKHSVTEDSRWQCRTWTQRKQVYSTQAWIHTGRLSTAHDQHLRKPKC